MTTTASQNPIRFGEILRSHELRSMLPFALGIPLYFGFSLFLMGFEGATAVDSMPTLTLTAIAVTAGGLAIFLGLSLLMSYVDLRTERK